MSKLPQGKYAIVICNEFLDGNTQTVGFERASDYYEYLEIQKESLQKDRDEILGMFGVDKGELN